MNIQLIKATASDTESMLKMQIESFMPHFQRYKDVATSPVNESLEKMQYRINYEKGCYFKILVDSRHAGCIWVHENEPIFYRIGIMYISPEFQCKGVGQKALAIAESLFPEAESWELDCPADLSLNRHCYEKVGYRLTEETKTINDELTLVFYRKEIVKGVVAVSSIIHVVDKVQIVKSNIKEINELVKSHIESLSYPMDSWLEDRLLESDIYNLMYESNCIGYAGLIKDTLQFFYVRKDCFRYAPVIFEKIVSEKTIKRVFIMTQDSLLTSIIAEWDYEKEKQACWFTDSERLENIDTKVSHALFRTATEKDTQRIRQISGDFFDEVNGGFDCLEKRITAEMIFLLEDNGELLGCGIVEKGRFCRGVASIGMYANRDYRRKGVAKTILMNLKEWAYQNNLRPVSGCWYYNTLSRKSLESVGMIATSIGYEAILKGKETLPLRTGNPPGELVRN